MKVFVKASHTYYAKICCFCKGLSNKEYLKMRNWRKVTEVNKKTKQIKLQD